MEFSPHWRDEMSARELQISREAPTASVAGPFFEDWEFQTLFGLERDDVQAILDDWPGGKDVQLQFDAVHRALNNLVGYPHGVRAAAWSAWLSAGKNEMKILLDKIGQPPCE
jgi:hypothetical protein